MLPILFEIEGVSFTVSSYTFFLALSIAFGVIYSFFELKEKVEHSSILKIYGQFVPLLILSFLVGNKVLFLMGNWDLLNLGFRKAIFKLFVSGGSILGGILTAVAFTAVYLRRFKLEGIRNVVVQSCILAGAFGKFSCFLAGCCWGKQSNLPISVTPVFNPQGIYSNLLPAQVIEGAGYLIVFLFVKNINNDKKFDTGDFFAIIWYLFFRIFYLRIGLKVGIGFIDLIGPALFLFILLVFKRFKNLKISNNRLPFFLGIGLGSGVRFLSEFLRHPKGISNWIVFPYVSWNHLLSALMFIIFLFLAYKNLYSLSPQKSHLEEPE